MSALRLGRRLQAQSPTLYRDCLALSLAAHALMFAAIGHRGASAPPPPAGPVEVDLTKLLAGGPAKLGAPKALTKAPRPAGAAQRSDPLAAPSRPAPPSPPPTAVAGPAAVPAPAASAGTAQGTQVAPPVGGSPQGPASLPSAGGVEGGAGVAPIAGGSGRGAPFGTPDGTGEGAGEIAEWPKLLNGDEIRAGLRRFYPEAERRAGREGRVTLAVRIGADGRVSGSEVLSSGGAPFDSAARAVAALMRFSPARGPSGAIAVKLKQVVAFRLED